MRRSGSFSVPVTVVLLTILASAPVLRAGGGGENLLLIVNPNDENALRMANAYAALRNIPANNIVFIAPPSELGYTDIQMTEQPGNTQFTNTYVNTLPGIIAGRGLNSQIDYISTVGQPESFKQSGGVDPIHPSYGYVMNSLTYGLSMLTQYQDGMTVSTAAFDGSRKGENMYDYLLQSFPIDANDGGNVPLPFNYTPGTNTAIHHSTVYPGNTQYYIASNLGYYGLNANVTVQQLINNLSHSVAGDGAKPAGKVYFENNTDVGRAGSEGPVWSVIQAYMTAHNIPWTEDQNTQNTGASPKNRTDVVGAQVGFATAVIPNGSTYLAGSIATNLTSDPSTYTTADQTKDGSFFIAGRAATVGNAIGEPPSWAVASSSVFLADGSTTGEAIVKSTFSPYGGMIQGDTLAQPYADVPKVTLTSAPANDAVVSGAVAISASASLTSPAYATGIASLQLYVDGLPSGLPVSAAAGTFNLDTRSLTDGAHEIRVVAVNNASAQSQGYTLSNIVVNNKSESVSATGSDYSAAWNQQLSIPVASSAGSGADGGVAHVDLRCLGRTVGTLTGASGSVALDVTRLAYGDNTLVPVAVYADGAQVDGLPLTVTRNFNKLTGHALTPPASRVADVEYDYWTGGAGKTIATTNFSGPPTYTLYGVGPLQISPADSNVNARHIPDAYRNAAGGSNALLAARITANFQTTIEGEYGFAFNPYQCHWTSLEILVDNTPVTSYDMWVSGNTFNSQGLESGVVDTNRTAYLMPGEHTLTFLLDNYTAYTNDTYFSSGALLNITDPTGAVQVAGSNFLYTPEPATLSLLILSGLAMLRRRRSR